MKSKKYVVHRGLKILHNRVILFLWSRRHLFLPLPYPLHPERDWKVGAIEEDGAAGFPNASKHLHSIHIYSCCYLILPAVVILILQIMIPKRLRNDTERTKMRWASNRLSDFKSEMLHSAVESTGRKSGLQKLPACLHVLFFNYVTLVLYGLFGLVYYNK